MSLKVNFHPTHKITWPRKCVQCASSQYVTDTVHKARYKGTGYYILLFTYSQQLFKLSYPVCLKHKFLARVYRLTFWLLIVPVLVLGLSFLMEPSLNMFFYFLVFVTVFVLSIKLQPLRIVSVNKDDIIIIFKNEDIAKEFKLINGISQ